MDRDFLAKASWCLRHVTSEEFYRGAIAACEAVRDFFKAEAVGRGLANYGRNNQIYDSWAQHARELERSIEFAQCQHFAPMRSAATDIKSTNQGVSQWVSMVWLEEAEKEYQRLSEIAGKYASSIEGSLTCGLSCGLYWLNSAPTDPPERKNDPFGYGGGDFVKTFLGGPDYRGRTPEENYPHFKKNPPPKVFRHYEPDTSRPCKTGDKVPFSGIWMSEDGTDQDRPSIVFAIEGKPMTPLWRFAKTREEVAEELLKKPGYTRTQHGNIRRPDGRLEALFSEYEIGSATWFPLVESDTFTRREEFVPLRVEGGQQCTREGWWWSPADNEEKVRFFKFGEVTPIITSKSWGQSYWLWHGETRSDKK